MQAPENARGISGLVHVAAALISGWPACPLVKPRGPAYLELKRTSPHAAGLPAHAAMSDTALQTEAGASEQAVVPSSAGEVASGQSGAVSFAEVVRVHYEWERAMRRGAPDDELEQALPRQAQGVPAEGGDTPPRVLVAAQALGGRADRPAPAAPEAPEARALAAAAREGSPDGRSPHRPGRDHPPPSCDGLARPRVADRRPPAPLRHTRDPRGRDPPRDERAHRDAVDLRRAEPPARVHRADGGQGDEGSGRRDRRLAEARADRRSSGTTTAQETRPRGSSTSAG